MNLASNGILDLPDTIEKLMFAYRPHEASGRERGAGSIPLDVLETQKEYVLYMDVPGISKSDIQVRNLAVRHFPLSFDDT